MRISVYQRTLSETSWNPWFPVSVCKIIVLFRVSERTAKSYKTSQETAKKVSILTSEIQLQDDKQREIHRCASQPVP